MKKPQILLEIEELWSKLIEALKHQPDWINIKEFGAKGDGVADDTAVFNLAIASKKNIYIPSGTYLVHGLILKPNQKIIGVSPIESWGTSVGEKSILKNNGTTYVIDNSAYLSNGAITPVNISNLTIDGNGYDGVYLGDNSILQECEIKNCNNGVYGLRSGSVVYHCAIKNNVNGINYIIDSSIESNIIHDNTIGIYLKDSHDNRITNNKIEWNGTGIKVDNSLYNTITSNVFDRNTTYGIHYINGSYHNVFGNLFERNLENDIYFYACTKSSFVGNQFIAKNENDDLSGSIKPLNHIRFGSAANLLIANNIGYGNVMFDKTYTSYTNINISGNLFNDRYDELTVKQTGVSIVAGGSWTGTIAYPTGCNRWSLKLNGYKIEKNGTSYITCTPDLYVHFDNGGIYVILKNTTATDNTYNIELILNKNDFNAE